MLKQLFLKIWFLFLFLINIENNVNAEQMQQFISYPVKTVNGLPQYSVLSMGQLIDGRLLIGTGNGFVLYNGLETEWIEHPLNKGPVRFIHQIDDFLFFIQIGENVYRFDALINDLKLIKSNDYLIELDIATNRVRFTKESVTFSDDWFTYTILEENLDDTRLIFSTGKFKLTHLRTNDLIIQEKGKTAFQIHFENAENTIGLYQESETKMVILTNAFKLIRIDLEDRKVQDIRKIKTSIKNDIIADCIPLEPNSYLIATKFNGFYQFNISENKLHTITILNAEYDYSRIKPINRLFVDNHSLIWVMTDGFGFERLSVQKNEFLLSQVYFPEWHKKPLFVTAFFEDTVKQLLYIGTHMSGLEVMDLKNNLSKKVSKKLDKAILESNILTIRSIKVQNQKLLLGCDNGLFVWDFGKEELIKVFNFKVMQFVESPTDKNQLYVMGQQGIFLITFQSNQTLSSHQLYSEPVFCALMNKENEWILGNDDSEIQVVHYDVNQQKMVKVQRLHLGNTLTKAIQKRDSIIWVSSDTGITLLDCNTFEIKKHYSKANGLPDSYIYGTEIDYQGWIWASSNHGLCRIQPQTNQIICYSTNQGLPVSEFNTNAFIKLSDARLVFGTVDGFVIIESSPNNTSLYNPTIAVSTMQSNSLSIKPRGNYKVLHYDLPTGNHSFTLTVQPISYPSPQSATLFYMLLPNDSNWKRTRGVTQLNFSNLKNGTHQLLLSNYPGESELSDRLVFIHISEYWWNTLIFKWILFILFVLLLIQFLRIRYKMTLEKNNYELREQLKLEKERNRIAHDLHDEIGSGLTQLVLMNEMNAYLPNQTLEQLKKTIQFSATKARELTQHMNDIIWVIKSDSNDLNEVFPSIREIILKLVENQSVSLNFEIKDCQQKVIIPSEFRKHILYMLKELTINTLKHAQASKIGIQINFNTDEREIQIQYTDNGNGFEYEQIQRKGTGISSLKNRIHEMKGHLKIESKPNEGLVIQIKIPLKGDR